MQIQVTQEHINNGVRRSPCDCPVATAIKEQLTPASVGREKVTLFKLKESIEIPTLYYFTKNFDEGNIVKPFSFDLPCNKEHYKQCED